jgi:hypothetical protein
MLTLNVVDRPPRYLLFRAPLRLAKQPGGGISTRGSTCGLTTRRRDGRILAA